MVFLEIKKLYGQITMTMIATVVSDVFSGTKNCRSVTISTTSNYDRATTATARTSAEDFSPTSSLRPAGTSLLLHSGYSNVDDSSTSFRELQKVIILTQYDMICFNIFIRFTNVHKHYRVVNVIVKFLTFSK